MITEAQRRALFALREALRLCEGAEISILATGKVPLQLNRPGLECFMEDGLNAQSISDYLSHYPEPTERFIGKATPETASGNRLSWRFRTVQGRILRWSGESTAAWWASEDKPQTVPGYRLDWATCDVFEVPV